MLCPCDLKKEYLQCCGRYHNGLNPENALSLMRSRYSAYALHNASYIIKTTHPQNPVFKKNHKKWLEEILQFSKTTSFLGLKIISFSEEISIAYVLFEASLNQNENNFILREKSLFEKIDGIWLYKEGIHQSKPVMD